MEKAFSSEHTGVVKNTAVLLYYFATITIVIVQVIT